MDRLVESTPRITDERGTEIFWDCVSKLASLGEEFVLTSEDFELGPFYNATGHQGTTGLGVKSGKLWQVITFNRNMLREGLEDLYLNTVYHELCHAVVNKYMIVNNIISLDEKNDMVVNDQEFFDKVQDNKGHGGMWLELAEKVTKAFNLAIPITANCSESEVEALLAANDDIEPVMELACRNCDSHMTFLSFDPAELPDLPFLVTLYASTRDGFPNHFCKKCDGTLYIILRDEKFKDILEKAVKEFAIPIMFMRMMGGML